jgi:hypothetical protein
LRNMGDAAWEHASPLCVVKGDAFWQHASPLFVVMGDAVWQHTSPLGVVMGDVVCYPPASPKTVPFVSHRFCTHTYNFTARCYPAKTLLEEAIFHRFDITGSVSYPAQTLVLQDHHMQC